MSNLEPTPGELQRRLDELGRRMDGGFRDVNVQLSALPTEKTILALLAARDAEMRALADDVRDNAAAIAAERADRKAADSAIESRADSARRLTWTIAGILAPLMLGVIVFVFQLSSGGSA